MKNRTKAILGISVAVAVFLVFSYLVQSNIEIVTEYFGSGIWSMAVYSFVLFLSTIFAPITVIPLFPVAANIWGIWLTVALSLIGWLSGAMLAFILSRKYGIKIVRKFFSLEEIHKYQKHMPQTNIFFSLLFFRIAFPFDIFNYLFGLLKSIRPLTFFVTTLMSFTIYAITFSYFGALQWQIQLGLIALAGSLGILIWFFSKRKKKPN